MEGDITIAFLGDIVGQPGKRAVTQQLPQLRQDHKPDFVIANAENARHGSGLTPELYQALRECGIDGMTLGDHAFRDPKIIPFLERPHEPVIRPANISAKAPGKSLLRLPATRPGMRDLYVFTVVGRIFFPTMPADDPFACADRMLATIPSDNSMVIVEAHMEATAEKAALAHYLDGRVAAVVGSHTHVATADARILRGGTAFITDMGMCGPYNSVIGRDRRAVVKHMTTGAPVQFEVGEGDERLCGCVIRVRGDMGLARSIDRIEYLADRQKPPFVSETGS
ncbi:MAG: YmdB family metallophosphoesterase [Phycisphaerales bacterium]|nr:YmdB family metallophosphoesterase [Phycisphaerales bacterium]